jgi:hypothetical protein
MFVAPVHRPVVRFPVQQPRLTSTQTPSMPPDVQVEEYEQEFASKGFVDAGVIVPIISLMGSSTSKRLASSALVNAITPVKQTNFCIFIIPIYYC